METMMRIDRYSSAWPLAARILVLSGLVGGLLSMTRCSEGEMKEYLGAIPPGSSADYDYRLARQRGEDHSRAGNDGADTGKTTTK